MRTIHLNSTIAVTPVSINDRLTALFRLTLGTIGLGFRRLCDMQNGYEMRQRMKRLDDRILFDIGKTRAEIDAEAAKPFWQ